MIIHDQFPPSYNPFHSQKEDLGAGPGSPFIILLLAMEVVKCLFIIVRGPGEPLELARGAELGLMKCDSAQVVTLDPSRPSAKVTEPA